jgi:hypothetical protein
VDCIDGSAQPSVATLHAKNGCELKLFQHHQNMEWPDSMIEWANLLSSALFTPVDLIFHVRAQTKLAGTESARCFSCVELYISRVINMLRAAS